MVTKLNTTNYHHLDPVVRIGKNGLTDTALAEIKLQLNKRKLIKVKFLSGAFEKKTKKATFDELLEKTRAKLVHKVGFVVVLQK